jgi:hypothetical protein
MQGNRLFVYDAMSVKLIFYSKNVRASYQDFRNTLLSVLTRLMKKYNKRNVYDLMFRVPNIRREINMEMNRLGYAPVEGYGYITLDEVARSM